MNDILNFDKEETREVTIGHNNPPSDAEIFAQKMKEVYTETVSYADKLVEAETRLPAVIEDDTTSGKIGDYIKQLKTCDKSLNAIRTEEKEVYLKGSRMVDGFFNTYREKLQKVVDKAARIQGEYLKKKEDEERRKREEEAERKREEAEAKLREAERMRKEAEEKRRIAEEEARKAAEEAERKQKEIEERTARERAAQEAEIAKLKAEKEAQILADTETQAKLKEAEAKLKEIEKTSKAELKEVKNETRAMEDVVNEMNKQAKADERESRKLVDAAVRDDKSAEKLDRLANKSAADLARTRGMEGSVSTVRTEWVGTVTDREQIDLEALRQHFHDNDLQIALNSWVKANPGKQLRGAFVREETKAMVR